MPHPQVLATSAQSGPSRLEDPPQRQLADAVSAASLSFVTCGAAVADFGELLRELRLALGVSASRAANPEAERAAALLAFRLHAVRGVLDEARATIDSLLEDCGTRDDRERPGREPPRELRFLRPVLPVEAGDAGRRSDAPSRVPAPDIS